MVPIEAVRAECAEWLELQSWIQLFPQSRSKWWMVSKILPRDCLFGLRPRHESLFEIKLIALLSCSVGMAHLWYAVCLEVRQSEQNVIK